MTRFDVCPWCGGKTRGPVEAQEVIVRMPMPDRPDCEAKGPSGVECTRIVGHTGDHVNCGFVYHANFRWPQATAHETQSP